MGKAQPGHDQVHPPPIRDPVGNTALEATGHGIKESSYSILAFPAAQLPVCYQNFVLAKWKRSLRDGNEYFKLIDSNSYFAAYNRYCVSLLNRPGAVIRIAIISDTPDVALGWSLIEEETLHYVFVQGDQRGRGIGKSLVPVPIKWVSHLTNTGMRIWNKHKEVKFNPF